VLSIADWSALFNAIGTTYNAGTTANGITTFAVPQLAGWVVMGKGADPALAVNFALGEKTGHTATQLTAGQLPAHTHTVAAPATSTGPTTPSPTGAIFATQGVNTYAAVGTKDADMATVNSGPGPGTGDSIVLYQPSIAMTIVIATSSVN
jgi:microcystin-dependent protein